MAGGGNVGVARRARYARGGVRSGRHGKKMAVSAAYAREMRGGGYAAIKEPNRMVENVRGMGYAWWQVMYIR